MKELTVSICILMGLVAQSVNADDLSSVVMDKNQGCMVGPMAEFGRYIGDWDIHERRLAQDGTWSDHDGTKWNFKCVGNGIAVQDFWLPANGGAGTNLRIYNAESESWDIAWTATATPGLTRIEAKHMANGNIVMHYISPIDPPRRITFFPPDNDGWNWTLEQSFDNEKTWTKVMEINASQK